MLNTSTELQLRSAISNAMRYFALVIALLLFALPTLASAAPGGVKGSPADKGQGQSQGNGDPGAPAPPALPPPPAPPPDDPPL